MWKTIPEFNKYIINENGEIKSLYTNKILKQHNHRNGYKTIMLYKNGKGYRKYIHRLVASAFIEKEDGKNDINHIDGDKTNNNYKNLEWVSKSENHKHRVYKLKKGNILPKPVKCEETGVVYESVTEASKKLKLKSVSCISSSANGLRHTAGNYHWRFI